VSFSSRPRKGFIRRRKSQQVTCSLTLPCGIVFPFSGTNFLRARHRDVRYRTSQPSLDTLTLSHTNFSYSICCPFRDRFFFHLAFFYLMFFFSINNSVLMGVMVYYLLIIKQFYYFRIIIRQNIISRISVLKCSFVTFDDN